jgi:hypothetical protein
MIHQAMGKLVPGGQVSIDYEAATKTEKEKEEYHA